MRIVAFLGSRSLKVMVPLCSIGITPHMIESNSPSKADRLRALRSLFGHIRENDAILIDYPGISALVAVLIAKWYRKKVVLRLRGDIWLESQRDSLFRRVLRSFVAGRVVLNSDALIFVSEYLSKVVCSKIGLDTEKCFVAYAPLRPEFLSGNDGSESNHLSHKSRRTIVSVTNFKFKGKADALARFLPIMNALLSRGLDCEWLILGEGKYFDCFVNALADYPVLQQRVHLIGWKSDVYKYYTLADAVVYLSYEDAMPNALSEAMAAGALVIVNDYAPLTELVKDGETGVIISGLKDKVEADCEKIITMFRNPDCAQRLGEQARKVALKRHSPVSVGAEFKKAIKACLQS